ncbi:hypothetical protein D3C85_1541610 [compost metagenome]
MERRLHQLLHEITQLLLRLQPVPALNRSEQLLLQLQRIMNHFVRTGNNILTVNNGFITESYPVVQRFLRLPVSPRKVCPLLYRLTQGDAYRHVQIVGRRLLNRFCPELKFDVPCLWVV